MQLRAISLSKRRINILKARWYIFGIVWCPCIPVDEGWNVGRFHLSAQLFFSQPSTISILMYSMVHLKISTSLPEPRRSRLQAENHHLKVLKFIPFHTWLQTAAVHSEGWRSQYNNIICQKQGCYPEVLQTERPVHAKQDQRQRWCSPTLTV